MEITIKIQAPELAHAIETLAIAIGCTVDKIGVGQAIEEAVTQKQVKETKKVEKETKKLEKVTEPEPEEEKPNDDVPFETKKNEDPAQEVTIEQVRALFVEKNSKANKAKLVALLKKYGVSKVTDLQEENFAEVIEELRRL